MLESSEYRLSESAAKAQTRSWWVAQTHHVDHFEKSGFPVRPAYFFEIGQLLDTMQENRFPLFQNELAGFSEADLEMLIAALTQSVEFQLVHFPRRAPILPLSTMASSLALYRKITGACAEPAALEVGPGCGYLSFFLAQDARWKEYSQAEAAESFYILQNRVNSYCFGSGFLDLAHQFERCDYSFTSRSDFEQGASLDAADLRRLKSIHYPWWTLGLLHDKTSHYDVVTSNANLNEFSRPALRDYLSIFRSVLKPNGYFIVQCTGLTAHGSLEDLFDHLFQYGFAPIFSVLAGKVDQNSKAGRLVFEGKSKEFALNNIVMVPEGHPLFAANHHRENFKNGFACDADILKRIYCDEAPRKRVSESDVRNEVANALANRR